MGKQRPILKHHADLALFGGDHHTRSADASIAQNDLSRVGGFEPSDNSQQRGFAAPARSQ